MLGSVFTMTALPLQIAAITRSPLAVGAVGIVELVPAIVFGLYGGVLADRFDRRNIALVTELALAVVVALLLINPGNLALLFGLAAAVAASYGLQQPALEAMTPRLVPRALRCRPCGATTPTRPNFSERTNPGRGFVIMHTG